VPVNVVTALGLGANLPGQTTSSWPLTYSADSEESPGRNRTGREQVVLGARAHGVDPT